MLKMGLNTNLVLLRMLGDKEGVLIHEVDTLVPITGVGQEGFTRTTIRLFKDQRGADSFLF